MVASLAPGSPAGTGAPRARRRFWLGAGLLALATVALGAMAACYLLLVWTPTGQRFDEAGLLGSYQQYPAARAASNQLLLHITAGSFAVVLALVVAIGIARQRILLGLGAAATAGATVAGADVLKHVLPRPTLAANDVALTANSFPSGHVATAVGCALALMLVSPPRWRGAVAVVAGGYASVTAVQVQLAGWHRPSDAIGATLLAGAAMAMAMAGLLWLRPAAIDPGRTHRLALLFVGLVAVAAAGGAAVGFARVLRWLAANPAGPAGTAAVHDNAYLAGVGATTFVVTVVIGALLALLGRIDLDSGKRDSGRRRA